MADLDVPTESPIIEPSVGHRYVLPFAPPMPPEFYGAVRFEFQAGRLISAVVEERLKP